MNGAARLPFFCAPGYQSIEALCEPGGVEETGNWISGSEKFQVSIVVSQPLAPRGHSLLDQVVQKAANRRELQRLGNKLDVVDQLEESPVRHVYLAPGFPAFRAETRTGQVSRQV
jgi:hypothetical protein